MKNFGGSIILLSGILTYAAPAPAHEAHVHGLAQMNLVVDGPTVELELSTPLANVISFEHEPETDAQKSEVRDMAAQMRKADSLFVLSPEAQCELKDVSLSSEALGAGILSSAGAAHSEDADDHDGHGDLDMDVTFICRHPENLNSVRVDMFRIFPNLHNLEVQMVTPKGQGAAALTPESPVIRW